MKTSAWRRTGAVGTSRSRGGLLHGHPLPPFRHLRQQGRGRGPRVVAAGLKHPLQLAGRVHRHPARTAEETLGTRERLAVERHSPSQLQLGFDRLLFAGLLVTELPGAVSQLRDQWRRGWFCRGGCRGSGRECWIGG